MPSISHDVSHDVTTRGEGYRRFEVITGERRRRARSVEEKLAIVAESCSAMTSISEVARRHQLNRNQLFQWRAQFRRGDLGGTVIESFIPLTISDVSEPVAATSLEPGTTVAPAAMIEVVMGRATVRIPSRTDEAMVQVVLAAVAGLR